MIGKNGDMSNRAKCDGNGVRSEVTSIKILPAKQTDQTSKRPTSDELWQIIGVKYDRKIKSDRTSEIETHREADGSSCRSLEISFVPEREREKERNKANCKQAKIRFFF